MIAFSVKQPPTTHRGRRFTVRLSFTPHVLFNCQLFVLQSTTTTPSASMKSSTCDPYT